MCYSNYNVLEIYFSINHAMQKYKKNNNLFFIKIQLNCMNNTWI